MRRETSLLRAITRAGPGDKAARDNPMLGRTLRSFRIVSEIGEGGMGVVYLAEHVTLPRRFAIKCLSRALSGDPNFRQRFYEEAQKQALLDDPSIVQVTDFFEEAGEFFLVMEYVDGQDLSRLIKAKGRLTESEARPIFREILRGLAFAHAKGLVHRDIKPSNVLVDKSGRARIMDFGISIMAGGAEKSLTAAGETIGSPWYMSPEQILHPQQVDQRTDIYALGILLYEMLTGSVPYDGETDFAVADQQVRAPARDPREKHPDISEAVARIVLKAMAKDPADRFQSCAELIAAVDALATPPVRPPWPRRATAVAAIVLAIAGIAVYVSWPLTARHPRPDPGSRAGEEGAGPSGAKDPAAEMRIVATPPETSLPETTVVPQTKDVPGAVQSLEREKAELARRSAYNIIQSGAEKAWFTCTQLEQVRRKELGLQSARLIQDTNIEERLRNQIRDHRANIESALGDYSRFLEQLAGVDAAIVGEQFDSYSRSLEAKSSFQQIQIARAMKRHYERHRRSGGPMEAGVMGTDCETVLGKGP
jgi:serine/threonine protein kinase